MQFWHIPRIWRTLTDLTFQSYIGNENWPDEGNDRLNIKRCYSGKEIHAKVKDVKFEKTHGLRACHSPFVWNICSLFFFLGNFNYLNLYRDIEDIEAFLRNFTTFWVHVYNFSIMFIFRYIECMKTLVKYFNVLRTWWL